MIHNKRILTGLDHSSYEHSFDKKALAALEATPGVTTVGKFITKHMVERIYTVQYTGSNLKVTKDNYPNIYEYLQYYYWNRMSEFTADRAGLLCCQDKDASIRAFMKMAGMPRSVLRTGRYNGFLLKRLQDKFKADPAHRSGSHSIKNTFNYGKNKMVPSSGTQKRKVGLAV